MKEALYFVQSSAQNGSQKQPKGLPAECSLSVVTASCGKKGRAEMNQMLTVPFTSITMSQRKSISVNSLWLFVFCS